MKLGRSPEARGLLPRKAEPTVEEKPVVPRGVTYSVRQPSMVDAVLVRNDPGGGALLPQPRELRVRTEHPASDEFFRDVILDTRFDYLRTGSRYRVVIATNPVVLHEEFIMDIPEYMYLRDGVTDVAIIDRITANVVARVGDELRRKLRAIMESVRGPNAR